MYNVTLRCHCRSGIAVPITNSEFVTFLISMQCACAKLSAEACLVVYYFSTLSHEKHDFFKKSY